MSKSNHPYNPRNSEALKWNDSYFDPSLLNSGFRQSLTSASEGVWSASLFSSKFCDMLVAETEEIVKQHPGSAKTFNEYGLHLLQFGFGPLFEAFTKRFESQFLRPVYPKARMEVMAAFVVKYTAGKPGHMTHEDSSGITLNVCLGKDFEGGDLFIARDPVNLRHALGRVRTACGEQYDGSVADTETMYAKLKHEKYRALIHEGRHMHGADPVTSGTRLNLIIWLSITHATSTFPFTQLPIELQSSVVAQLEVPELLSLSRVSHSLRDLVDQKEVWVRQWQKVEESIPLIDKEMESRFSRGKQLPPKAPRPAPTTRKLYVQRYMQTMRDKVLFIAQHQRMFTKSVVALEEAADERYFREETAFHRAMCLLTPPDRAHVPDNALFPPCNTVMKELKIEALMRSYFEWTRAAAEAEKKQESKCEIF